MEFDYFYGLMLDQLSLSMKNRWFDAQNRACIVYSIYSRECHECSAVRQAEKHKP